MTRFRFRVELVDVYCLEVEAETEQEARRALPNLDDFELYLPDFDVYREEHVATVERDEGPLEIAPEAAGDD